MCKSDSDYNDRSSSLFKNLTHWCQFYNSMRLCCHMSHIEANNCFVWGMYALPKCPKPYNLKKIYNLTYQALSSTQSSYLHSLLTPARNHLRHLRSSNSDLIFAPRVKTKIWSMSFFLLLDRLLMRSNCGVIGECSVSPGWRWRKMNKWVLDKIGSVLMLRISTTERKIMFDSHIVRIYAALKKYWYRER